MKKIMLSSILLVLLITIGFVFANPLQYNTNQELKEEIQIAIQEKDYSSFVELHRGIETTGKAFNSISQENFELFAEMKQAIIDQDYERAREIREEIGIPLDNQKLRRNMQQLQKNQRLERNENKGIGHNKGNGQAIQMRQQKRLLIGQK